MAWLLDTCVLSELRKPKAHPGVTAWMAGLRPEEASLLVVAKEGRPVEVALGRGETMVVDEVATLHSIRHG